MTAQLQADGTWFVTINGLCIRRHATAAEVFHLFTR